MLGKKRTKIRRKGKPFQEIFDETIRDALKKDPGLLKNLAFRSAGFPDLLGSTTSEYQRMMRLEETVVKQALDQIEHNPEIRSSLARITIAKIFDDYRLKGKVDNLKSSPLIPRVIEMLKKQARDGQATAPITGETLLKVINEVGSGRKSDAIGATKRVVQQKNIQQKREPGPAAFFGKDAPLTVGNSLVSPVEFVTRLKQEVLSGVAEAQHLWNFLLAASSAQVSELLDSHWVSRQDRVYIRAITSEAGKNWVNKVIELVRQATA